MDAIVNIDRLPALPDDLSVFSRNDSCIKLWVPERLTEGLDRLRYHYESSRPDVLRWIFFEHVYGRPAFEILREWKRKQDEVERKQYETVRFSPVSVSTAERTVTAQLLGKSVDDFKLWLPSLLKAELEALSKSEGLGLSDYLRKTLVRILLGEAFHHQWRAAVGKLPAEVMRFESQSQG